MTSGPRLLMVLAAEPSAARDGARQAVDQWRQAQREAAIVEAPPAAEWPFRFPLVPPLAAGPLVITAAAVDDAFVNHQSGATRLVTTQAMYLIEEWSAALTAHESARMVGWADLEAVRVHATEILARRGVFGRPGFGLRILGEATPEISEATPKKGSPLQEESGAAAGLARAFRSPDPAARLALCVEALGGGRTAAALVATASACMEVNDLAAAARDLDEAIELAPGWAAARFERGKCWLRADDMARAADCFRAAAERLPGFGPAWANLGAAEGELDRAEPALAAFERALAADPDSAQAVNNVGVISRELGRLPESEAAFRRVIELAPEQAFGYYNLGHTLFLQGRYQAALTAYTAGQSRDPERNAVQASRLALCRLATGDGAGALDDLQRAAAMLPREVRGQLLADTSAIVWALVSRQPGLEGWAEVQQWLQAEMKNS